MNLPCVEDILLDIVSFKSIKELGVNNTIALLHSIESEIFIIPRGFRGKSGQIFPPKIRPLSNRLGKTLRMAKLG